MDNKEDKQKKVFISYSWTNSRHEKWVYELAERLVNDGVNVILDKWDLKEGQDKYTFMESMIQDTTIDKVLIICEKGYKDKANKREGGVGTETQIITPELYEKTSQTKYIPIIAEEGENSFDEYLPTYIKSRIAIAMSSPNSYETGYEQLLRVIYNRPQLIKPKIGKKPSFLDNESKTTSKLYFINKSLKKYIENNRQSMISSLINDFYDAFWIELDSFIINSDELKQPFDEQLINNIDQMKDIRNEYISFLEDLIKGYIDFNSDIIIEFFEKLYSYTGYKGIGGSWNSTITEHFKFLVMELFLWTNIMLFKYKKYNIMRDILYTRYYVEFKYEQNNKLHFSKFRDWLSQIESRSQRLDLRRLSITADKLTERATYNDKNYKDELVDMDIMLYYISMADDKNWFPVTYIYKNEYRKMKIIEKMERKQYFDDIKILFNVNTKEEMKKIIEEKLSKSEKGYSNSFARVPSMSQSINVDDIAKY